MVGIVDFCMVYTIVMCFLLAFFPLILKTFVNNAIEKRHHCKLDVEQRNVSYIFLYSYFKYFTPGKIIAVAYLFNSQKMIDKNLSLKSINYNLKTAPKKEIFICVACWLITLSIAISSVIFIILVKGFGVNP